MINIYIRIQGKGIIISHLILYKNNGSYEGRIGLFDSQNLFIENIAKFNESSSINEAATTQNKVNSYVRYFD